MLHKVFEEWFDTILFVSIVMGLTIFFCVYWRNEYLFCHAKLVLQEFADKTAISGKITDDEYVKLNKDLQKLI